MSDKSYTVGWYVYTPDQLAEFPPEYQDEIQTIETFGIRGTDRCYFSTPGEAQGFLQQIVNVNHTDNLKRLTPLGAEGLFIVERETTAPGSKWKHRYSKYSPPGNSHIIPIAPAQAGGQL